MAGSDKKVGKLIQETLRMLVRMRHRWLWHCSLEAGWMVVRNTGLEPV